MSPPRPSSSSAPGYEIELSGTLDQTGNTVGTETGDIARSWYAYVINDGLPFNVGVNVFDCYRVEQFRRAQFRRAGLTS